MIRFRESRQNYGTVSKVSTGTWKILNRQSVSFLMPSICFKYMYKPHLEMFTGPRVWIYLRLSSVLLSYKAVVLPRLSDHLVYVCKSLMGHVYM